MYVVLSVRTVVACVNVPSICETEDKDNTIILSVNDPRQHDTPVTVCENCALGSGRDNTRKNRPRGETIDSGLRVEVLGRTRRQYQRTLTGDTHIPIPRCAPRETQTSTPVHRSAIRTVIQVELPVISLHSHKAATQDRGQPCVIQLKASFERRPAHAASQNVSPAHLSVAPARTNIMRMSLDKTS